MNLFITGLPRCGSTFLAEALNLLPNVEVLGEAKFFGSSDTQPGLYQVMRDNALDMWGRFIAHRKGNVLRTDAHITTIGKENYLSSSNWDVDVLSALKLAFPTMVEYLLSSNEPVPEHIVEKTPMLYVEDFDNMRSMVPKGSQIVYLWRGFESWANSWIRYAAARPHNRPQAVPFDFKPKDSDTLETISKPELQALLDIHMSYTNWLCERGLPCIDFKVMWGSAASKRAILIGLLSELGVEPDDLNTFLSRAVSKWKVVNQ